MATCWFNYQHAIAIDLPFESKISLKNACKKMSIVSSKSWADDVNVQEFIPVNNKKKQSKKKMQQL